MQTQAGAGDFSAGAIHHQNAAFHIGGEQAAAHGFYDVLIEGLQVFQFLALGFELEAFFAQGLGQQAAQISDGKKREQIAGQPGIQHTQRGHGGGGARDEAVGDQLQRAAQEDEAESGYDDHAAPRKQDAGHEKGKEVERDEVAILHAGGVHHAGNQQQIASDLQRSMPAGAGDPAAQDDVENGQGVPERDQLHEGTHRHRHGSQVTRGDDDADKEGDGQEADPSQPRQPFTHIGCGLHFRFFTALPARIALRDLRLVPDPLPRCESCRAHQLQLQAGAPRAGRLDAHAASAARVLVACQFADQREQRQVHGYDDAADDHAQDDDHDGLHGGEQVFHGRVHLIFVEVRDFLEHRVHGAGLFADADHLGDHAGEHTGVLQRINERATGFDGFAGLADGTFDDRVTRGARGDVQTFENGYAAGDQGAQGAREARDGDLSHERADQRNLQNDGVNRHATLGCAVPGFQSEQAADKECGDDQAVDAADEFAHHDHDARGKGQVHTQAVEKLGEDRDDLPQQQDDDAAGDAHDGDRVDHRGLHGALELDVLFDVAGEALQNGVQNTARLTGFDHVVVERVKDLLELLHGGGKRGA